MSKKTEQLIDTSERISASETRRRKIMQRSGLAALLLIGYGTYFARDIIRDELHEPDQQEQVIERALEDAYETDVKVRCLDDDQMKAQENPFLPWPRLDGGYGAVPYAPIPNPSRWKRFLPYVRLNQKEVCDRLSQFMSQPPQGVSEVDNDLTPALQTAAHEMRHVDQVGDEAQADCEAIQLIHELAISMGAGEDAAFEIQARNTRFIKSRKSEEHLQSCYPEGPYYLDLGLPLYFPYGPPGAPDQEKSVQATP